MPTYRARKDGLVGTSYIHEGEVFTTEEDRVFSWADKLEDSEPETSETEEPAKPAPKTKKSKGK